MASEVEKLKKLGLLFLEERRKQDGVTAAFRSVMRADGLDREDLFTCNGGAAREHVKKMKGMRCFKDIRKYRFPYGKMH